MNDDMSQYLGVFLDEANEQMELLERDILVLEQQPSMELLQGIFRAAHTLKGSSRAMGFTTMGELTHAMEDVFDKLRHGEITVSGELINALFDGLDALKEMKDQVAASGSTTLDAARQTARLRASLEAMPAAAPAAPPVATAPAKRSRASGAPRTKKKASSAAAAPPAGPSTPVSGGTTILTATAQMSLQEAIAANYSIFCLTVQIAHDCVMKSVRALMVLQALEHIGSILATTPGEEELENEEFAFAFEVVFASQKDAETIRGRVCHITEIVDALVVPWAQTSDLDTPVPQLKLETIPAMSDTGSEPAAGLETAHAREAEEATKSTGSRTGSAQAQTVRVDVARLDKLLNLVGELVIDRTRIAQLGSQLERAMQSNDVLESLNETSAHIGRITDELQEEIMKARMLPIDNVFNRFPRMVRDLAQKLGKEINFEIEGKETELDRSVIEVIGDPLIHMLRNSVDHGIETPEEREQTGKPRAGLVSLRARHEENHIVLEIEDDGKGMNPETLRASAIKKGILTPEAAARMSDREAINLIFGSGFSMAKTVSEVSGRGVGMDIVRSNLQKLGATIDIESKWGHGSTFTVKLPLTLAIIRGLLVRVNGSVYALPLVSVVETLRIEPEEVHVVNHREVIVQRGRTLPIVRLRDVFHLADAAVCASGVESKAAARGEGRRRKAKPSLYLVVVGAAEKQVGLVVDTLIGEQEVVIKALGKFVGDIRGISGATILGDGRVALIVDINGIITIAVEEKGRAYAA